HYQDGDSGEHIVELKEDLTALGFANWSSPSQYYGSVTVGVVENFQDYYDLPVTGIADTATRDKIAEILSPPYQSGDRGDPIVKLKEDLTTLGFANWSDPSQYYGSVTVSVVEDFQKAYGLEVNGIVDEITFVTLLEAVGSEEINTTQYDLTLEEALAIQMGANPQTDNEYDTYVSKTYIDDNNKVTANTLNVRGGPGTNYWEVGQLSEGTEVTILNEVGGWYQIEYTENHQWVNASSNDVLYQLDPTNFLSNERERFQFLDLARNSNATATELDIYLNGKGILENQGQAFIDAGSIHGVSDVYLVSHARLETGNGGSALANGVEVGKNPSGDLVLVTSNNKDNLTDIETTYNMFGIGAVDGNAHQGGAFRAYEEGWFSPDEAIVGGAQFIGDSYIKAGQNTLYSMRWNPAAMAANGTASHQYATDIGWASKQIFSMYNLYQDLGISNLYLDVPQYK
ncbi:N-acetylglucosaminidase, partial [Virgibacillus natechei]